MRKLFFCALSILILCSFLLYIIGFHLDLTTDYSNPSLLAKTKIFLLEQANDFYVKPSHFINHDLLQQKLQQRLPAWAIQQITDDLSSYQSIKKENLKNYFHQNPSHVKMVYIEIKNGKLRMIPPGVTTYKNGQDPNTQDKHHQVWVESDRSYAAIFDALKYLVDHHHLPDTEFILGLDDYVNLKEAPPFPIFTFAKDLDRSLEKDLPLFPDWMNLRSANRLKKEMQQAHILYPFLKKEEKVFWRGGEFDSTGFRKKIVQFSKKHPEAIDAEFVAWGGKKHVKPKDHLKYKYLISIDGERATWERLLWQLHGNSLVLKHQSNQVQWYYKGIIPNIHYLSVADENSILKAMAWAKENPREAQIIIKNANIFAEENLNLESMLQYIVALLTEYNKKFAETEDLNALYPASRFHGNDVSFKG